MWEKELELIDSLGKLYPGFDYNIKYRYYQGSNRSKAQWVFLLCKYYLEYRIPSLEKFIKKNSSKNWYWYSEYFKITDEQCGKKS